ncbi:hypothetical protein PR048_019901 [Dryococelus australis]|uniref:Uncharacterized protein n=1 Tax=Dryococelus australis TaxID=614101 RepID=A0ABQ9H544_9NEOP|nr:hypothetical protein PR048_019901 [Dryococelus australis]
MTSLISQITFHQIKKKEGFVISSISGLVSTLGLTTILQKNAVSCFTFVKALRMKLVQHKPQYKSYLIYDGFSHWKKAVEKFSQLENSSMHNESTEKFILLQQTPVVNQINKTLSEQEQKNHVVLRANLTTAKYIFGTWHIKG